MKRTIILITAAALALVGCNKVQDVYVGTPESHEIAFQVVNQPSTKAAVQGATFPTANTMEVVAYQSAPETAANYFEKTTFGYKYAGGSYDAGNDAYWAGTTARYWPLDPNTTLNFFAVSGAGVNASDITIATNLATAAVEFDATAGNNTSNTAYSQTTQSDIMYAFGRGSVTQTGNTLVFPVVGLTFKHALALVKFQVKAGNAASESINVTSIVVNGAKYTGDLALANTGATATSGEVTTTVTWTPNAAVDAVTVPNTAIGALDDTNFAPADGGAEGSWACLMIVPGTGNGISTFVINYTIGGKAYSYTYNPSLANTEAGKVYTYKIIMTLNEIKINPEVTEWTNGTGSPFTVNVPPTV